MASTTEKSIDKCPACYFGETDCHAYKDGHCIALNALDKNWIRCPFYKSEEQYQREDEKALARLRKRRMTGRLEYYRKEKANDGNQQKKQ